MTEGAWKVKKMLILCVNERIQKNLMILLSHVGQKRETMVCWMQNLNDNKMNCLLE